MADLLFSSREAAPEPLRPLLAERDGKFILSAGDAVEVPGYVPKSKHDEFRTNNVTLTNKLKDLEAEYEKYKGIDPDAAREALTNAQKLKEQGLLDAGKLDDVVAERLKPTIRLHEDEKKQLNTVIEGLRASMASKDARLSELTIFSEIEAVSREPEIGALQPGALFLLKKLAAAGDHKGRVWRMSDKNEPECLDAEGKPVWSVAKPEERMSIREWASDAVKANSLGMKSSGGGAAGNPAGGGFAGEDLMKLSPQERMNRSRLRAA